jgi:hypothetical protein
MVVKLGEVGSSGTRFLLAISRGVGEYMGQRKFTDVIYRAVRYSVQTHGDVVSVGYIMRVGTR